MSTLQTQFKSLFADAVRNTGFQLFIQGMCSINYGNAKSVDADVQEGDESEYVQLDMEKKDLLVDCTCERFDAGELCKHIWATLLASDQDNFLRDSYGRIPMHLVTLDPFLEGEGDLTFKYVQKPKLVAAPPPPPPKPTWDVVVEKVAAAPNFYRDSSLNWPEGRKLLYVLNPDPYLKTGPLCIELMVADLKMSGEYGKFKQASMQRRQIPFLPDPADRAILQLIAGPDNSGSSGYYSQISPSNNVDPFFAKMAVPKLCETGRFVLKAAPEELPFAQPLSFDSGEPWTFTLRVSKTNENYQLDGGFRRGEEWILKSGTKKVLPAGFLCFENTLALAEWGDHTHWLKYFTENPPIEVPASEGLALIQKLLDREFVPPLEVPEELRFEDVLCQPKPHLKIHAKPSYQQNSTKLRAGLTFQYEEHSITADANKTGFFDPASKRYLRRNMEAEKAAVAQIVTLGLKRSTYVYRNEPPYELSEKKLPQIVRGLLAAGFEVEAEGRLVKRPGKFDIGITSGIDWFELHGDVDYDGHVVELPQLLKALEKGETMVRLGDGSFGVLPEEWLKQFGLLPALGEAQDGHIRFKRNQAGFLDALLLSQPQASVDETFQRAREELRRFEGITPGEQPAGFQGTLRGYQLDGLGWFEFLRQFRFGGCLADDMGVGKTAQVLAMLEARRQETPAPSLVVAPKSLIFNWKQEAARFTPQLRVLDCTGADRSHGEIPKHDLVFTTYGTLLRDIATLRDIEFDYAILDESQAVKNSSTESAKAARLINAHHRLALSGTPVENHLGELWSLFEFLNPGMLGAASVFKLAGSAGRNPGEDTRMMLGRAVRPFILRRTKEQVIKELPEKSEQTLYCELEPAQRKVYNELRDHFRARLLKLVDKNGLAKSKIQVLEALLRLRQAACHPRLIDSQAYTGPSAKLDMLLMHLEEIRESGHKALVFSQFTSMLAIVRESLDRDGVRYAYLDGQTNDRQAAVRQFQEDPECPLFLISLKAGGVGLNLTAAEYVFLLDPWWNPAVEAQAVDRAHRIGQERRVFAYRLIARDTVEEKVLELQKSKRDLADSIINAENSLIAGLGREDLELLLS